MWRMRRWVAPVIVALTAGVLTPPGVGAAGAGLVGTGQTASASDSARSITVTELLGPDGEPLAGAGPINQRGQVVVMDGAGGVLLWHRGTTAIVVEGPGLTTMVPNDISERGQVVGNQIGMPFFTPYSPWSWRDRRFTALTPGNSGAVTGVNERGQILGSRRSTSDPSIAETVVWQDGEVTVAPADVATSDPGGDINNRGQALIDVDPDDDGASTAAVWEVGGGVTELGTLGGGESWGVGIDERGRVVGVSETGVPGEWHAFLWRGGEMIDLGTLGGPVSVVGYGLRTPLGHDAVAFNERGEVAGSSQTASGEWHAFLWRDGEMIDLGTLGGSESRAVALNNHGQVVGLSETASGEQHAFLWQDGEMIDIGILASPARSAAGAINDRGQIGGYVEEPEDDDPRAVLWTAPPRRRG